MRLAEKSLCTDNAAMIDIPAGQKLKQEISIPSLDEEFGLHAGELSAQDELLGEQAEELVARAEELVLHDEELGA